MGIDAAVLMCHAPIVVPAVGRERGHLCRETTIAMRVAAQALVETSPDAIVVISPHAPRISRAWGVCFGPQLAGSFARFGAPGCDLSLPGAPELARGLASSLTQAGLRVFELPGDDLDHGAAVPLYFAAEAGWRGPTLLMSLSFPTGEGERRLGQLLREYADRSGSSLALLASGDMSHRLHPGAPAGFHPDAERFDAHVVERLKAGDLRGAVDVDRELRETAAEDVVSSLDVALGALGSEAHGFRFLAYEGPFGVGYAEAILCRRPARSSAESLHHLLPIARRAVAELARGDDPAPLEGPGTSPSRGVFVTLRTATGDLRGCIGHIEPQRGTLEEEVTVCARAAASADPRFPPVSMDELDGLRYEVSVLTPRTRVLHPSELDPQRYGVLVSQGRRRGVLLPAIPGVDSVETQLEIARSKGRISPDEPFDVYRFSVLKLAD